MQLSEHFTLREFVCHDGTPVPDELVPGLKLHCERVLEVIRAAIGVPLSIVSGFRTVAYNRKIGGAKASFHLWDKYPDKFATDLSAKGKSPEQLRAVIETLIAAGKIPQGGIGLYSTFVHYDNRGYRRRWNG